MAAGLFMELFDKETIFGIVADGRYNRKKAAILQGQPLTPEQRGWWDEAEILRDAEDDRQADRAAMLDRMVSGEDGPMTGAERVRKHNLLKASIDDVLDDAKTRIDWERRRRVEKSLLEFVKAYGCDEGGFLDDPPAPLMESILDEMQTAVDDSSIPYHIRVARGHGKTSYSKLACAWAAATGKRHFIIAVGSNADNAKNIVNDLFGFFGDSPLFAQDFPEIAVPIAALNGVYQRARAQTYHGKPTRVKIGMGQIVLPTIDGSPSSGCIIQSVGFETSARGKVKGKLRPDLLVLDDLQNDEMAENEERVLAAVTHLKKTFLGLAGHKRKIAAVMTSTPIAPDDLSETFAADPSWKTTTHKMIIEWPTAWKTADPEDDLWTKYRDILRHEIAVGNPAPHLVANKYYHDNFDAMNHGAVVLNPNNYDRSTELSAIQHAMNLLFRDGEKVFDSEYQMQPPRKADAFGISAQLILSRIRNGAAARSVPDETVLTVAASDLNPSYAITTAVACFDVQLSCFVTFHAIQKIKIDGRLNDTEFSARLFAEIKRHGELLSSLGLGVTLWGIDAGGRQFGTVTRFARQFTGLKVMPMIGRAGQNWNPNVRSRIRAAKNDTVLCHDAQRHVWLAFNADTKKEQAQRAWITETGAVGGCSLFDGGIDHTEFAEQIANERLIEKVRLKAQYDASDRFEFRWKVKGKHDYGDVMAMLYALAGAEGISGEGSLPSATKSARRRKTYTG